MKTLDRSEFGDFIEMLDVKPRHPWLVAQTRRI
jgi:hypothetical protein